MIEKGQPVVQMDMDALATLAVSKLGGAYKFNAFAGQDRLALAQGLTLTAAAGGSFAAGGRTLFRVYSYKTIAGVKSYSPEHEFTSVGNAGANYSITANWTDTADVTKRPDGYIVAIPVGSALKWRDMLTVKTLTEDGNFSNPAWKTDNSLAPNLSDPTQDMPCGRGTWLKTLCNIHRDAMGKLDLFGGATAFSDTHKVSADECVSVAQKCYLYLNSKPIYKDLKFVYSEADSVTGNSLSLESDIAEHIGISNGANSFTWNQNVNINGRMVFLSGPAGQNASDWTLAASAPGVTITFDPNFNDDTLHGVVTGIIFDFVNVQFTVGTPIVLTATPLAGQSVFDPGNPAGTGCLISCTFTGDASLQTSTDYVAIHSGSATVSAVNCKAIALSNALGQITLTSNPAGGSYALEGHHRVFCNGVFVGKSLPTNGMMTFLDVDLPQYDPQPPGAAPASSRRQPMSPSLPFIPVVGNRSALWLTLKDSQFEPDFTGAPGNLMPFNGSPAFQTYGTSKVSKDSFSDLVPPYSTDADLIFDSIFVAANASDVRFITYGTGFTIYAKAGDFPTTTDYDFKVDGGNWFSARDISPGFTKDTFWYFALQNHGSASANTNTNIVVLVGDAPYGQFLNTVVDDSGADVPQLEGESYHFNDDLTTQNRPIPQFGYCIYSVTVRRAPVDNDSGAASAPSAGTSDLLVNLGVMRNAGWDNKGTFELLQAVTIPAGQASVRVDVFWPVLKGVPLAYQCDSNVTARTSANFQPLMRSLFSSVTTKKNGQDYLVGYYNGKPWYENERTLLFFNFLATEQPIELPISAQAVNELTDFLNVL